MLNRIEIMQPSTSSDESIRLLRPQLVANKPVRRKREVGEIGGKRNASGTTSTSASIRDETMELLPMPPRKRLRRAQKVYPPPPPKDKSCRYDSLQPWWNRIQVGDERPGSFNGWQEMKNSSTGSVELDRENEAFAMRSSSITSIDSCSSDSTF